ncbi:MAG TPA: hypothetical protein PKD55_01295 [Bellilinea sp.]|nr:hypothetical protein [Bellilinea sp.]
MARLIDWINKMSNNEPIEAVIIGEMGWSNFNEPPGLPGDYKDKIGIPMSFEEAIPYITYEFDSGYGAPGCTAMVAYTTSWIVSVVQYDGSTAPIKIPRNPKGYIPDMPGG